ncbi:hypothetical protein [Pseudoscardovia radai]|uniref:hypothetical protein n=1 Tax=Pseudoscardovia radai TaxID=987066 RepID=UPI0039964DBF
MLAQSACFSKALGFLEKNPRHEARCPAVGAAPFGKTIFMAKNPRHEAPKHTVWRGTAGKSWFMAKHPHHEAPTRALANLATQDAERTGIRKGTAPSSDDDGAL